MTREEFAQLARAVVEKLGEPRLTVMSGKGALRYSDDIVRVDTAYNGLDLQVTRVKNRNPVLMVKDGAVIRLNAEYAYIAEHMMELVK